MAASKIGDKLINDAGTCVTIADADDPNEGEIAAERVRAFLAAGYRPVKATDDIPLQSHEAAKLKSLKDQADIS
jgi:hypothetical protein